MTVLDRISADTLIFLQLHKRVWPTAQRDALFWSHIREISSSDPANGKAHDTWIVCNQSAEHPDAPVSMMMVIFNKLLYIYLSKCESL